MHCHQLALQMRGKFGHLKAMRGQRAAYLVAVGVALGGEGEVEQPRRGGGNLHAPVAEARRPAGDVVQ